MINNWMEDITRWQNTWMIWPPHSTSTLGLSTVKNWTLLRSLSPQKRTSNLERIDIEIWFIFFLDLYLTRVGLISWGIGRIGPVLAVELSLTWGKPGSCLFASPSSNISNAARSSPVIADCGPIKFNHNLPASSFPRYIWNHSSFGGQ